MKVGSVSQARCAIGHAKRLHQASCIAGAGILCEPGEMVLDPDEKHWGKTLGSKGDTASRAGQGSSAWDRRQGKLSEQED